GDTAHRLGGFGEVGRLTGIVVIQVFVGWENAIIGDSGKRARGIAGMSGSEPVERVGKVLADAETEAAFAGGIFPKTYDIALWSGCYGVPARLVFRVP